LVRISQHEIPVKLSWALRDRLRRPFLSRFAGVDILVGYGVYYPTARTEALVEIARLHLDEKPPVVVDVGTGSGAVALAIAAARPEAQVISTDISRRYIRWAIRNARRLGLGNVRVIQGSLLDPLPPHFRGRVSGIVANMPWGRPRKQKAGPPGTIVGPG